MGYKSKRLNGLTIILENKEGDKVEQEKKKK